ncbi:Alpha/Beta hydrolase protein [Mycena rosella]|uniref:triacylglycerol lipase n=1 Tax=Mycena rosella TaxID=1033263 RepID=A0AAD7CUC7_MYCRO|nr:Alpha/Beta hydrolase protein [Mycena rosella]
MLSSLPTTLRLVLAAFLWTKASDNSATPPSNAIRFQLRHAHAVAHGSRSVFADVPPSFLSDYYEIPTQNIQTHRPPSAAAYADARLMGMRHAQSPIVAWDAVDVTGPDVRKRATLLQLAKMTSNSYYGEPGHKSWYPLDGWNASLPFGWEPDADGFRGHVFVSTDNNTVVISVKGTSAPWIAGGEGPTKKKDKINDNLLFSCCCARVGPTWYTVCDCYSGGDKCDLGCLERALVDDSLFYQIGTNLYNDVAYMYPNANIWMTGASFPLSFFVSYDIARHSLGGSLAALLGATFGVPVVAFETPGEKMAATRLHLPSPPTTHHITHVYHTGDPIPMGTCTGVASACALAGFALESRCHLGQRILYDTHGIQFIIEKVLNEDWEGEGGEVPEVDVQVDCVDCFNWQYGDFK